MANQLFTSGIVSSNQTAIHPATIAQTLGTCSISENRFPWIEVNAIILFTTTGTSGAQTASIQFINSTGPTTLQSFSQGLTATAQNFAQHFSGVYRKNDKGTITVVLASGTADANTNITLQGFYVIGLDAETQYLQA